MRTSWQEDCSGLADVLAPAPACKADTACAALASVLQLSCVPPLHLPPAAPPLAQRLLRLPSPLACCTSPCPSPAAPPLAFPVLGGLLRLAGVQVGPGAFQLSVPQPPPLYLCPLLGLSRGEAASWAPDHTPASIPFNPPPLPNLNSTTWGVHGPRSYLEHLNAGDLRADISGGTFHAIEASRGACAHRTEHML